MRSAVTFRQSCAAGFLPPSLKFTHLLFSTASTALHAGVLSLILWGQELSPELIFSQEVTISAQESTWIS